MTEPSLVENCLILTIWVPVGECPGLTFSLLAKVFAKGKMFWYMSSDTVSTEKKSPFFAHSILNGIN